MKREPAWNQRVPQESADEDDEELELLVISCLISAENHYCLTIEPMKYAIIHC